MLGRDALTLLVDISVRRFGLYASELFDCTIPPIVIVRGDDFCHERNALVADAKIFLEREQNGNLILCLMTETAGQRVQWHDSAGASSLIAFRLPEMESGLPYHAIPGAM